MMSFFEISGLLGCGVLLLVIVRAISIYHAPKYFFCILWIVLAFMYSASLFVAFPPVYIWGFSICIIVVYFLISNLQNRKKVKRSIPDHTPAICNWITAHTKRKYDVRVAERIIHPTVIGNLHPIVLFPKNFDRKDKIRFLDELAQQYVYIRYFTQIFRVLIFVTLSIHWFNPLVWVMYILSNRDVTLLCDMLTTCSSKESKYCYALSLIKKSDTYNKTDLNDRK